MNYWLGYSLFLFLGGGGLIGGLVYLRRAQPTRPLLQNLILLLLALGLTWLALEFYFKVFFAQADGINTLAQRNWYNRYYAGAMNSLGYRDVEWTAERVAGKTKVMVVGDSFVEGAGIERPEDRFPDQLAQQLGPAYVVFNLGLRGADTSQEIEAITEYPYPPDILILTYFVNDIEGVARGRPIAPPPKEEVSPLLLPFIQNSYAFNFFYWRVVRLWQAGQPDAKWLWLLKVYNDPETWWLHQQELISIYEGARSEQIPLIVVVFPGLTRLEESRVVTGRIIHLYQERGVPTLDVADLLGDIPPAELVASPVDAHPSELVHRRVAEALYGLLVKEGVVK